MDISSMSFSASSIKDFNTCGIKFWFAKGLKLKPLFDRTHSRWMGKLVHNSIYQSVGMFEIKQGEDEKQSIKTWVLTNPKEPQLEHALILFESLWDGKPLNDTHKAILEFEVGKYPVYFSPKKKVAAMQEHKGQEAITQAWRSEARKMVENGVKTLKDIPEIVQLELPITFELQGQKFTGFVDVVGKDEDGRICFYDFKTSWDKVTPDKIRQDPQFIFYAHALKEILNLDYYPTGYLVHLRSGALVEFTMTNDIMDDMLKLLDVTFNRIKNDVYLPIYQGPDAPLCSYCDFQSLCKRGAFTLEEVKDVSDFRTI